MKKVVFIMTISVAFMACSNSSSTAKTGEAQEEAQVGAGEVEYTVDPAKSEISWTGIKPAGDDHSGTVAISEGKIATAGNQISAGKFVIDMTQMTVTDEGMDDESKAKLVGHLSNEDFFEVGKYPTAMFIVTSATADSLTGNLTIKDVTKSISLPYFFQEENGAAAATASVSIDRTEWGITFNSGNFFKNLGNHLIDDEIPFEIKLELSK